MIDWPIGFRLRPTSFRVGTTSPREVVVSTRAMKSPLPRKNAAARARRKVAENIST